VFLFLKLPTMFLFQKHTKYTGLSEPADGTSTLASKPSLSCQTAIHRDGLMVPVNRRLLNQKPVSRPDGSAMRHRGSILSNEYHHFMAVRSVVALFRNGIIVPLSSDEHPGFLRQFVPSQASTYTTAAKFTSFPNPGRLRDI
jgi:hypothetical protein